MNTFFTNGLNKVAKASMKGRQVESGKILKKASNSQVTREIIDKIESFGTAKEATNYLIKAVEAGDFECKGGVLFKKGETFVQNALRMYGEPYAQNMKRISDLGLDITPKFVKSIPKNNEVFIVSEIAGTASGQLLPYREAFNKVSKESKLAAFKDLQKLTKAGLTDEKILRSDMMWFVTPDSKRIVLPSFESLRPIPPGENQRILDRYYQILFRKN